MEQLGAEIAHARQTTSVASGERCKRLVDERLSTSYLSWHLGVQRRNDNVSKPAQGVAVGASSSGGRCRDMAENHTDNERDPSRGAAQGNWGKSTRVAGNG
jgi:hypothetical protein